MAKPLAKQPVAKKRRVLYRCIAETSIVAIKHERSRRFGPGQIVDLEELIGKGYVRSGTFEAIDDSMPSAPREKSK